ncbi:MAG: ABC transporter ATP-binding protein/permease [Bacteroidales bacterium]|nr:ABC transporter ATP-binding protein/permease [Bacteroidales bacterium]
MKEFWKIMVRYSAPYKGYLFCSVFLNILSAILNIFSFSLLIPILQILFKVGGEQVFEFTEWTFPMSFDQITNNMYFYVSAAIDSNGPSKVLMMLCLIFCGITLVKTACYFGSAATIVPMRTGITRDIRREIYHKIIFLPIGFFSQERKGDIVARMSGDVQEVENSITSTLDMLLKNPILIIFYMGWLFYMSWKLTLFTIIFAPVMIWIMSIIGRKLRSRSLEAQSLWSNMMSQLDETLGGLRVIKAFLAEKKMSGRFDTITDNMRRKLTQVAVRQSSAHPVSEFLGTVMIAIVLWYGGTLILSEHATIDAPTFLAYIAILYSVIQPIKDLSRAAYGIPKGLASMERIDHILLSENPISEPENPENLKGFNSGISIRDLSFRYSDEGRIVLDNINCEFPKGKTIAIVGASGAGKSTLVDLIPRFYDVTQGSICIDGTDIRNLRINDLRSLMGNVNQDPILFNDTIFNNIAFGKENATMEEVIAAAKIANAHDFIMEKEDGYQTMIGDRGVKLSGGQRQRLSIARAILKNPPILILDEATAALDTESEHIVQEALDRLMSNRTTIAIAHRLSTIKGADNIIVMDEGRIVETGTHEELLAKNGYYKKLNDMQAL